MGEPACSGSYADGKCTVGPARQPQNELTPKERAELEERNREQALSAERALTCYEKDPTSAPLGPEARLRLGMAEPKRLREADANAQSVKQSEEHAAANAQRRQQAANEKAVAALVTNLTHAAEQVIPPLCDAVREARVAGKLKPNGQKRILKAMERAVTERLVASVRADEAVAAVRAACAWVGSGETIEALGSNLVGAAAVLERVLSEKAGRVAGELLSAVPTTSELVVELASVAMAAAAAEVERPAMHVALLPSERLSAMPVMARIEAKDALPLQRGEPVFPTDRLPTPLGNQVGTLDYYRLRHEDYLWRHISPPPPDYYLNYGEKYVYRFSLRTRPLLSAKGQAWVDQTRINLQRAIEKKLDDNRQEFDTLEQHAAKFGKFAYRTHPDAYLNAGLHNLPPSDLFLIVQTPDPEDLRTDEGLRQVVETAKGLLREWGHDLHLDRAGCR